MLFPILCISKAFRISIIKGHCNSLMWSLKAHIRQEQLKSLMAENKHTTAKVKLIYGLYYFIAFILVTSFNKILFLKTFVIQIYNK